MEKAKTPAAKPAKTEKVAKEKSSKYGNDIREQVVKLHKEGKSLGEIVKTLNGPKAPACRRYLKAAGIELKKENEKKE